MSGGETDFYVKGLESEKTYALEVKFLSFCYVCGKVNLVSRQTEAGAVDAGGSVWELI